MGGCQRPPSGRRLAPRAPQAEHPQHGPEQHNVVHVLAAKTGPAAVLALAAEGPADP